MQLLSNNTTANVSTAAHGYAPILPNNVNLFLNGTGTYTAPVANALIGTSTTSLTIGTGSTTFTTQSGLTIGAGQYLIIPSNANSANYFFGQVTSYSGTTLVVNVTQTGGSGTNADWNIFASGPPGPAGSGNINSGTTNELAYYATGGTTLSGLATANSGVLVTSGTGVPSISTAIPAGVTLPFSGISSGTNTSMTALVGTGGSLGVTGSGTIVATSCTGNAATVITNANLTGGVTSVGNAATVITNANLTGGVTSVGNAATVITNANLTGVILSVGNATSIASQTGTGSTFAMRTSPQLITPALGTPTSGNLSNCTNYPVNVLGTPVATTSGTSIAFTGIPLTSTIIKINFLGVKTSGNSDLLIQKGSNSGYTTTGYLAVANNGLSANTTSTAGFIVTSTSKISNSVLSGTITLSLENSTNMSWGEAGILADTRVSSVYMSGGSVSESTLGSSWQVKITTVNGTDTFTAGEINIQYS
jgi:hypothetical protein